MSDGNELDDLVTSMLDHSPDLYWRSVLSLALRMDVAAVRKLIEELNLHLDEPIEP